MEPEQPQVISGLGRPGRQPGGRAAGGSERLGAPRRCSGHETGGGGRTPCGEGRDVVWGLGPWLWVVKCQR